MLTCAAVVSLAFVASFLLGLLALLVLHVPLLMPLATLVLAFLVWPAVHKQTFDED